MNTIESLSGSEVLSRRDFVKILGPFFGGLVLPPPRFPEKEVNIFKPGDPAPESWGGAGVFDVVTCYIADSDFNGQVLLAYKKGRKVSENKALVIVCGRQNPGQEGELIRGTTSIEGNKIIIANSALYFDKYSDEDDPGGIELYYDQYQKKLSLSFDKLAVTTPEGERKELSFHPVVKVHDKRSNILAENREDDLRHYMRAGFEPMDSSKTKFFMMTHASLRVLGSDLYVPNPPEVAFDVEGKGFLTVIQRNRRQKRIFVWLNNDFVIDPQAEYLGDEPGFDNVGAGDPFYYVPIDMLIKSSKESGYYYQFWLEFPDITHTNEYGFLVPNPVLDFSPSGRKLIAWPTYRVEFHNAYGQRVDVEDVFCMMPKLLPIYRRFFPQVDGYHD